MKILQIYKSHSIVTDVPFSRKLIPTANSFTMFVANFVEEDFRFTICTYNFEILPASKSEFRNSYFEYSLRRILGFIAANIEPALNSFLILVYLTGAIRNERYPVLHGEFGYAIR